MLKKNILIKNRNKNTTIKANDAQQKLIKKNEHLTLKAKTAQKIYNRSIFYIIIYFIGIFIISFFDDNNFIFKFGSIVFTAIAIPSILSLNSISFDLMKEVDNETIWKENNINGISHSSEKNNEEINLLKNAIEELSQSNKVLKENLNVIEKQSQRYIYKTKSHRKYR